MKARFIFIDYCHVEQSKTSHIMRKVRSNELQPVL